MIEMGLCDVEVMEEAYANKLGPSCMDKDMNGQGDDMQYSPSISISSLDIKCAIVSEDSFTVGTQMRDPQIWETRRSEKTWASSLVLNGK